MQILMRMTPLRLGLALHALFVVHLGRDLRVQATTSSLITTCNATSPQSVGDGFCDRNNNNEDCEYDGGDCCPCTCEDGVYLCGANDFDCQDPMGSDACSTSSPTWTPLSTSAGMYDTANTAYPNCSSVIGHVPYIGDGYCDSQNNNEECGYDGGDCCLCMCVDGSYSCGVNSFSCMDPMAPEWCADATSHYSNCSDAGGLVYDINDGNCDSYNNNEECGYDGGDCCNCTCVESDYPCGYTGFDCQDPTVTVECANITAVSNYTNCTESGGHDIYIGNGYCNWDNNNEECGYDGGDCCACTCVDSEYLCGIYGYRCEDPSVSIECANVTSQYPNCTDNGGYEVYIGDGSCSSYNNIEECGYDGGDCCACTCVDGSYTCGVGGYNCQDPTVSLECATVTSGYPNCTDAGGYEPYIGNGICNSYNNNEECAYDGGDCCACTCDGSQCGASGYHCQDPTVSSDCANETAPYNNCTNAGGSVSSIGNGYCHSYNNIEECGYDGGDCCPCTCKDGDYYTCGSNGFSCLDPTVSDECSNTSSTSTDYDDDSTMYPDCGDVGGSVWSIGNGYCSSANNNEECGYDGGDCCACTCVDGSYTCGYYGYDCQDPTVMDDCSDTTTTTDDDDSSTMYPDCGDVGGYVWTIGNGYCSVANNNEECGYDGGDCCGCTCVDGSYTCGYYGYDCQDPTVAEDCSDTVTTSTDDGRSETYPDCESVGGDLSSISTGFCTSANNNEECGYDGGDCCPCTCVSSSHTCGTNGYDCRDPDAYFGCSQSSSSAYRSQCTGDVSLVGNGACDAENNNVYCDYDGGDCCSCTCFDEYGSSCEGGWYDCHDPDANCSEMLGTVGVALITGSVVFVLTLCCYFATRAGVINRIRGGQGAPESRPQARRTQGAVGPAKSAGAGTASTSAPVIHGGYVVHVGAIAQQKVTVPEPTAPPLPQPSAVENEGEEEKKSCDPKCSAPRLPPVPEHPDVEDNGQEEVKTSDPKAPAPPSSGDVGTVEEGTEERKTLY